METDSPESVRSVCPAFYFRPHQTRQTHRPHKRKLLSMPARRTSRASARACLVQIPYAGKRGLTGDALFSLCRGFFGDFSEFFKDFWGRASLLSAAT